MDNSMTLQKIAHILNEAVTNNYSVELRVEDIPSMDIDSTLKTTITEVSINEEGNCLHICASGLKLRFHYESYELGTESSAHKKLYFVSKGATLTIIVFM